MLPLTPSGKNPPDVVPAGGLNVDGVETPYTTPRSWEVVRAGARPAGCIAALPVVNTVKYCVVEGGTSCSSMEAVELPANAVVTPCRMHWKFTAPR